MSTWSITPDAGAGDIALIKQVDMPARSLSKAAATHQAVQLAGAIGNTGRDQSIIDDQAAPLKALQIVASGMVDAHNQSAVVSMLASLGNLKPPPVTTCPLHRIA